MTFEMPKLPFLVNVYHQRAVSSQVFKRLTLLSHVSQNIANLTMERCYRRAAT